jgi:hypothetical protein
MCNVDLGAVTDWSNVNGMWCPKSVDAYCPRCHRQVTLTVVKQDYSAVCTTFSCVVRCPGCTETARLWAVDPKSSRNQGKKGCGFIQMWPAPRELRAPATALTRTDGLGLARAYAAACDAYNAGLWDACATSCRRTLEGLVKTRLSKEEIQNTPKLARRVDLLAEKIDLKEPLANVGHALREGGNIGAHFDLERTVDRSVAELMLDLLDFLMNLLYSLPKDSTTLVDRVKDLSNHECATQEVE